MTPPLRHSSLNNAVVGETGQGLYGVRSPHKPIKSTRPAGVNVLQLLSEHVRQLR